MIIYKGFLTLERKGKREIVRKQNAVAALLIDRARRAVLLVEQVREPMVRRSNRSGKILEVLAGTRDEKIGLKRLIVKETREEVGKRITDRQVKLLNRGVALATSPGWATERLWLAFVELDLRSCVRDSSRTYGLAAHDEFIKRKVVTFDELERMTFADAKTALLVKWFLLEEQLRKGK